jgi:hypothetical protein
MAARRLSGLCAHRPYVPEARVDGHDMHRLREEGHIMMSLLG